MIHTNSPQEDTKKTLTQAKLDDGSIVAYDFAGNSPDSYPHLNLTYLGEGVVYAVDGVWQPGLRKFHFFTRNGAKE